MRRGLVYLHALLSALTFAAAALVFAATLGGCVRRYEEPALTEPHALVKFRVLHHASIPRSQLSEAIRLNGYDIAIGPGLPTTPRLRTVRALPVPTEYRFATEYFHTFTTTRTEYRTETYSCGYGTNARTCSRTVPRTVTQHHHVTDAACEGGLVHTPLVGAVYLIQYDFYGPDHCTASCFRQLDGEGDTFRLVPCGPSEPPVGTTSGGAAVAPPPPPAAYEPAPSGSGGALTAPR